MLEMRKPLRGWIGVALVVGALGLAARVAVAWRASGSAEAYLRADEEYFLNAALLRWGGVHTRDADLVPEPGRAPLFPEFLALAGPSPLRAYLALAAAGAGAALGAWALGAGLHSPLAGFLACALASLHPLSIQATARLDVHGFYGVMLLSLALAASAWARSGGTTFSSLWLGVALAASLLTRSAHLAAFPLLAIAAVRWWGPRAALAILVAFGGCALGLLPWTIRHAVLFGRALPLDAGVGSYNLMAAVSGGVAAVTIDEAVALADAVSPGFHSRWSDLDAFGRQVEMSRVAWAALLENPGLWAAGIPARLWRLLVPLLPLLPAAIWGALRGGRGAAAAGLVLASLAAYAAIGVGEGYSLDGLPLASALAGVGLASWFGAVRETDEEDGARLAGAVLPAFAALLLAAHPVWLAREASRARSGPCSPAPDALVEFFERGEERAGRGWYLSGRAGRLRARGDYCAGLAAYASGDAAESVRRLSEAARIAPLDAEISLSLGVALDASGRSAEAGLAYDRAVALARERRRSPAEKALLADARSSRAGWRERRGDRAGAREDLREALAAAPRGWERRREAETRLATARGR